MYGLKYGMNLIDDRADGYTDAIWITDMNEMVANIRDTGNQNIISSKLLKNKDKMKVFS
jgi:hypothetical protein